MTDTSDLLIYDFLMEVCIVCTIELISLFFMKQPTKFYVITKLKYLQCRLRGEGRIFHPLLKKEICMQKSNNTRIEAVLIQQLVFIGRAQMEFLYTQFGSATIMKFANVTIYNIFQELSG